MTALNLRIVNFLVAQYCSDKLFYASHRPYPSYLPVLVLTQNLVFNRTVLLSGPD